MFIPNNTHHFLSTISSTVAAHVNTCRNLLQVELGLCSMNQKARVTNLVYMKRSAIVASSPLPLFCSPDTESLFSFSFPSSSSESLVFLKWKSVLGLLWPQLPVFPAAGPVKQTGKMNFSMWKSILTLNGAINTYSCLHQALASVYDSEYPCHFLQQAVCCEDHIHCCPAHTTCDVTGQKCNGPSGFAPMLEKVAAFTTAAPSTETATTEKQVSEDKEVVEGERKQDRGEREDEEEEGRVPCDSHTSCPDHSTCCFMVSAKKWGCCPLPEVSQGVHSKHLPSET